MSMKVPMTLSGIDPATFQFRTDLKQGDMSQFFQHSSKYNSRKVNEDQKVLKSNGSFRFMVYADGVNLLNENINFMKRNT
jgi:hypothetical protein